MTCAHTQAHEVIISGGEVVACVCANVDCLQQLPPIYIAVQVERAWRVAHCRHGSWIELTELSKAESDYICMTCGVIETEESVAESKHHA